MPLWERQGEGGGEEDFYDDLSAAATCSERRIMTISFTADGVGIRSEENRRGEGRRRRIMSERI